jgi:hypothetical protein
MKTAYMIGMMQDMLQGERNDPMFRLRHLRRIPLRYRNSIPLSVMRSCRCIVIGGDGNSLTVAFSARQHTSILDALAFYTGCTIFPVYVSPSLMRLLISRLVRYERQAHEQQWRASVPVFMPVQMMLFVITGQKRSI